MAFPWVFESNFEAGDNSEWDTETDTGSLLDFPHYSELARTPGMGMPWAGAYAMRVQMGDTNDHTLTEADMNVSLAGTAFARFYFYLGKDVAATADDTLHIFELQSTGNVAELTVGLRITALTGLVEIGIGKIAPTVFATETLPLGKWYAVELEASPATAAAGTGTLYLNGVSVATIGSLTNLAVTHGVLGTQATLATTTGTVMFDSFIFDELRVYPQAQRWSENTLLTKSGHAFVGPGKIDNVTLLSSTGTDDVLEIFDTDTGDTTDASNVVVRLQNTAAGETVDPAGMPATVTRGAYVNLTGTQVNQALVKTCHALVSEGSIRNYGLRR